MKLGLALGGGGVCGVAHIGALKAFEEAGIEFDIVTGTSVGSMVGALYAGGITSSQMFELVKTLRQREIMGFNLITLFKNGYLDDGDKLMALVNKVVKKEKIEHLGKKYAAVSMDFATGEEYIFTKGDLDVAVAASCAVPGVFKPVLIDNKKLVDGGIINNLPISVAKDLGADYVVAVDVLNPQFYKAKTISVIDNLLIACMWGQQKLRDRLGIVPDVMVQVHQQKVNPARLKHIQYSYDQGYIAAQKQIEKILKFVKKA